MQVIPTELILKPGAKVNFRVRLFDERGVFIREEPAASWSLDKLQGEIANGQLTVAADAVPQAGLVTTVAQFPGLPVCVSFRHFRGVKISTAWP